MSRLLIQCSHISKSFGPSVLLNDISLSIHAGDCFALIGENGCGKTTLLQILRGSLLPNEGEIQRTSCRTVGFLPQEVVVTNAQMSLRSYLEHGPLKALEQRMEICLMQSDRLMEWETLHEEYEQKGGYRRLPVELIIQGVGLEPLLDSAMSTLSSGQRVRAALAKAFIDNPDLLLLDEPTNHLDESMLLWLEEMVHNREGATVIVSHDRRFLNKTCTRLIEITNGSLLCYGGSYDFYLEEKDRQLKQQIQAYEAQEEEKQCLRQKIKAISFSKAKASPPSDRNIMAYDKHGEHHQKSVQRTVDTLKHRLEELDAHPLSHPKPKSVKGLFFPCSELSSHVALEFENVGKAFENRPLFSGLSYTLLRGDRIILKGPNGSGKTTLLRCAVGHIQIDSGAIRHASNVKIGYLDQEVELLPLHETPAQYFETRFQLPIQDLRSELHKAALGGGELVNRPFSTLSVGQRKRLMILSLILEKPNVLLLDEPTNHLDFLTMEALENALLTFKGAILAVSHDTTFIQKIATGEWMMSST